MVKGSNVQGSRASHLARSDRWWFGSVAIPEPQSLPCGSLVPLSREDGPVPFSGLRGGDRHPILQEQQLGREGLSRGPGSRLACRSPRWNERKGSPWASGGCSPFWLESY